ncbi:hypothetical protein ABW19_dt0207522 [Dactylella cylindrospora]|nr:hypothetical protein ABW19_dt0207522 [Dactylella cylindrospora]
MVEGAVGSGLEGNVIEAYNFAVLNYSPGDQILCFGFSRGAYTARAIAGLISDIGICEPRNLHHFHEIWELYKLGKAGERFYGSDAYFEWADGVGADEQPEDLGYGNRNYIWLKEPHGDWATQESREIKVVGVYDTVGALGFPSVRGLDFRSDRRGFHNVYLNRNIKHAFHALGLDEHREAFSPTLWSLPAIQAPTPEDYEKQQAIVEKTQADWYAADGDRKLNKDEKKKIKDAYNQARRDLIRMEEAKMKETELLQVWFPGVHINVGGGANATLRNEGDLEEISNITFAWMLDHIAPYVSINQTTINQEYRERQNGIDQLNLKVEEYKEKIKAEEQAAASQTWGQWFQKIPSAAVSTVLYPFKGSNAPDLRRRDHGWGTGAIIDSYTKLYYASGSTPRTPGNYANHKDPDYKVVGETNEQIHPIVGYRLFATKDMTDKKLKYEPLGERKVRRKPGENGTWVYDVNGVELPEYKIRHEKELIGEWSYERLAVNGEEAAKYLRDLDVGYGYPIDDIVYD